MTPASKNFFICGLIVILAAYIAIEWLNYSVPEVAKSDPDRERAIERSLQNRNFQKQPKCYLPIIVTIADVKISLPRGPLQTFTDGDGNVYEFLHHRCEIKELKNIKIFWSAGLTIREVSASEKINLGHAVFESLQNKYPDKFTKEILPNGVEKTTGIKSVKFVFPSHLIPHYGHEPITLSCHVYDFSKSRFTNGDYCLTNYYLRQNLLVSYSFYGVFFKSKENHDPMIPILKMNQQLERYIEYAKRY